MSVQPADMTISEFFKAKYINCLIYLNNEVLTASEHQFDYDLKQQLCNPETNTIDVLLNYVNDIVYNKTGDELWQSAISKYNVIGPIIDKWKIEQQIARLGVMAAKDDSIELTFKQVDAEWFAQIKSLVDTASYIIASPKALAVCNTLYTLRLNIFTWIKILRYISLFKKLLDTPNNTNK